MKFSIIVPCYNLAPWIQQCLDSVASQDFKDWECVVIDDESTDNSGQILDEYARRDSRFKIIHQVNAGEGGARNAGLSVAKGEWIFFLDGDDLMLPHALAQLVECITEDDKIIRFKYTAFDDGTCPSIQSETVPSQVRLVDISQEIRMEDFYTYVWQHVYRRSVTDGLKFKRYIRGCDRVYLSKVLLQRVDKVKVVDCVCYGYRKRAGSAMNSVPSRQVLCDEMDHRLDIMEMIDDSGKRVTYAGNVWLEGYFVKYFYYLAKGRSDKNEVVHNWRSRLKRLMRCKGISAYGRFVAWSCAIVKIDGWSWIVCYAIPRFLEGGSPISAIKRMLIK